jgi:hypothetical protein
MTYYKANADADNATPDPRKVVEHTTPYAAFQVSYDSRFHQLETGGDKRVNWTGGASFTRALAFPKHFVKTGETWMER